LQKIHELKPEELYRKCDPAVLGFKTTAEIKEEINIFGQDRASQAIDFGINVSHPGYNIFVLGPTGTGKREVIQQYFKEKAKSVPTPSDYVYVHNFDNPDQPDAIRLQAGMGIEFQNDIDNLIEEMQTALSAAFESEEYQNRRQTIFETFKEKQANLFSELQDQAEEKHLAMIKTPSGIAFAPRNDEGVLSAEEVNKLTEEEREKIKNKIESLQEELQKILQQVPIWQREAKEKIKALNKEMADFAIGGLINELLEKYQNHQELVHHINKIKERIVENANAFMPDDGQEPTSFIEMMSQGRNNQSSFMDKFKVNVIINNKDCEGAPVVYENNPTYPNLIGRVEHYAQMGALITDFRMIKPGALHKANGGYLILNVRKVLNQPYAWEGLKRALQSKEIEIESIGQALSLISTVTLKPEPIPLDLKIALVGDRILYYLLVQYDPEFSELFKVQADFETEVVWDEGNQALFAKMFATMAKKHLTKPFSNEAVARVIEMSSREASDSERLNTRFQDLNELIIESNYWAEKADREIVTDEDVQSAIDAKIQRADRLWEKQQEAILRNINLISTEGEVVGQINGLSVYSLGRFMFGRPTRITAQTSLGKGQVIDIEREVEMGGPIHSKGVMILSGFLKGRYAQDVPLSLSASLVFEQSYGGVDGDSASSAELFALISSIAQVPLKQNLAVTGSVNQHGQIQAIGGVNQKIEGFYDICRKRGLSGDQGVMIPAANVKHLMLRQDVIKSVEAGEFHIYPISHIDEGIQILTGMPAGEKLDDGSFTDGTINAMVKQRLEQMANKLSNFGKNGGDQRE
jgi:lon-related putative ATP-dependent protease